MPTIVSPTDTATVTLNPSVGGCTGSCFAQYNPNNQTGQASFPASVINGSAVPDTETTVAVVSGQGYFVTTEYFQQTLSDSAGDSFYGRTVTEQTGQTGTDTCYNNDPNSYGPMTGVNGSSWVVGQPGVGASNGPEQWGGDNVGYYSYLVAVYRSYNAQHGISSCGFTVYQNMWINVPSAQPVTYSINILSATIYSTSVVDCRQEGTISKRPYARR